MKADVDLMCNGWRDPVILNWLLGKPREIINVNTRLTATIEGTPEQIAALEEGVAKGYHPEFWVMKVKQ